MRNLTKSILAAAKALLEQTDLASKAFTRAFDALIGSFHLNTHEEIDAQEQTESMEMLNRQVREGNTLAIFLRNVFSHYEIGINEREVNKESVCNYFENLAKEKKVDTAYFILGCLSERKADAAATEAYKKAFHEEAVKWYRKAADQGNAQAQLLLGICYARGTGVQQDVKIAVEWYQQAAEQGNARAQLLLGNCYASGQGVQQDVAKAFALYQQAAEQGDANAQISLGDCYAYGQGVQQDVAKAFALYQQAADQGNARAQLLLGNCYAYGQGVPKDVAKAFVLYQQAAEQGDAVAQVHLGDCYAYGKGVPKDIKIAVEWYKKAAAQELSRAKVQLFDLYINQGYGIDNITEQLLETENASVEDIGTAERTYHVVANTDTDGLPDDSFKLGVHACTPLEKLTTFNDKNYQFVIYPGVRIDELFKALPSYFGNRIVGINKEVQNAINFYRQVAVIEVAGQVATSEAILQEKGLPPELRLPIHADASGLAPYFSETFLTTALSHLTEPPRQLYQLSKQNQKLREQNQTQQKEIEELMRRVTSLEQQAQRPTPAVDLQSQCLITGFFKEKKRKEMDSDPEAGMGCKRQRPR